MRTKFTEYGEYAEIMAILPFGQCADIAMAKVYGFHDSGLDAINQWFSLSGKPKSRRVSAVGQANEQVGAKVIARKICSVSMQGNSDHILKYRHFVFPSGLTASMREIQNEITELMDCFTHSNFYEIDYDHEYDTTLPDDLTQYHRHIYVWKLMLTFLYSRNWPLTPSSKINKEKYEKAFDEPINMHLMTPREYKKFWGKLAELH